MEAPLQSNKATGPLIVILWPLNLGIHLPHSYSWIIEFFRRGHAVQCTDRIVRWLLISSLMFADLESRT